MLLWLAALFSAHKACSQQERHETATASPAQEILLRQLASWPTLEYYLYVPSGGGAEAPVFVAVHGLSRNAHSNARRFAPHCEEQGAVLVAPIFDAQQFDDYQRLGREGRGKRADLALDAILEEVGRTTGAQTTAIYLFGFSGGAQFAHRYALAHPGKVAKVVAASAGWYTFPDSETRYPYGIQDTGALPGVRFEPERFLHVPIHVMVGAADIGNENLHRNDTVDRQQGVTRVERAQRFVQAMRSATSARSWPPRASLTVVQDIRHSFSEFMEEGDLGTRVFEAFFGPSRDSDALRLPVEVGG